MNIPESEKAKKIRSTLAEIEEMKWEDMKVSFYMLAEHISKDDMRQYLSTRWNLTSSPREMKFFIQSILQSDLDSL